ncbi:hypothetical protein HanIR_Chr09g0443651 [Helianthus annuus]|nr:hypothetical protein HanIR_Chr09g0443651 [Helianthus annuus]
MESGCDGGGRGAGGRRLWKILVVELKPLRGSTEVVFAIDVLVVVVVVGQFYDM